MKARIVPSGQMFVGQVYGRWDNILLGTHRYGWETVTSKCFTKLGAKYELRCWKRKNTITEL